MVDLNAIVNFFTKAYKHFSNERITAVEQEMRKIIPCPEGAVLTQVGYNPDSNKINITFSVRIACNEQKTQLMQFPEMISKLLEKTAYDKLLTISKCIKLIDQSGTKYTINCTKAEYWEEYREYEMYLFIAKIQYTMKRKEKRSMPKM